MQPTTFHIPLNRRNLIRALCAASTGFLAHSAFAEALTLTPRLTQGPYFPDHLPLDQDNDLIRVTDHLTAAVGKVTNVGGRILDPSGTPVKGALIELWQADNNGCYIHSAGAPRGERDPNFQGYGKFETGSDGAYRFRTIKPGLYTGRTRHYHFGITLPGQRRFTTQLFFANEPGNERDMVLNGIRDAARRASVIREFAAIPDSPELQASWDIVIGLTPEEGDHDDHDHGPDGRGPGGPRDGRGPGGPRPGRGPGGPQGERPAPPPPRDA